MSYQYIRLHFDFGDLAEMNSLSSDGWRVVAIERIGQPGDSLQGEREYLGTHFALMERQLLTTKAAASEQGESQQSARAWLCAGGGGFEDGEDGIRACTMSAEHAIELMDAFAASKLSAAERTIKSAREIREAEKRILIAEIERNKSLESQLSQARQDAARRCRLTGL